MEHEQAMEVIGYALGVRGGQFVGPDVRLSATTIPILGASLRCAARTTVFDTAARPLHVSARRSLMGQECRSPRL